MNVFKITFVIVFIFLGQNLFSQKFSFKIQSQYSHYENEHSEKADQKIVFLCNNEDDTTMKFFVVNDTVKNISIYDKKENKIYISQGKFVLNKKTDINQKLSSQKFEYIQIPIDEKTNSNVKISTNIVDGENIINVKEVIKEKTTYDLYLKTNRNI